jgi:hypothetical protein
LNGESLWTPVPDYSCLNLYVYDRVCLC